METQPNTLVSAKGILQLPDRRVLVMQRNEFAKSHALGWEFPGGKVDAGETPFDALIREVAEEAGLNIEQAELTPVGDRPFVRDFTEMGRIIRHEVHFSVCRLGEVMLNNLGIGLSDAHRDYQWISPKELKDYALPIVHSRAFKHALKLGLV